MVFLPFHQQHNHNLSPTYFGIELSSVLHLFVDQLSTIFKLANRSFSIPSFFWPYLEGVTDCTLVRL
jgi:hypothetical protein